MMNTMVVNKSLTSLLVCFYCLYRFNGLNWPKLREPLMWEKPLMHKINIVFSPRKKTLSYVLFHAQCTILSHCDKPLFNIVVYKPSCLGNYSPNHSIALPFASCHDPLQSSIDHIVNINCLFHPSTLQERRAFAVRVKPKECFQLRHFDILYR